MKLKLDTIFRIQGYDHKYGGEIKRTLQQTLGKGSNTIYLHLRENKENGELTKLAALEVIAEFLNTGVYNIVE